MKTKTALAVIAAAIVAASFAGAGAGAAAKARLRPATLSPLVLRGTSFQPQEQVRIVVRVSSGPSWTRTVTASRLGLFRITFADVKLGHCTGFVVKAIGRAGSRATLRHVPRPACMPV